MSISIRSAKHGDEELVMDFVNALARYEKLDHEVKASKEDIGRDLFCEKPRVFCDIAEIGSKPIGFALYYYTYSTFRGRHGIWLEDLFVNPKARGLGAGKALMAHLAKRCKNEGLARFEWWVLDWNKPSIDFYQSLGAVLQDEWSVCRVDGEALNKLASM